MSEGTEVAVLQQLVPELEADGYDVYLEPNRPLLPPFLAGYAPDAIALRADKNLVIEVARRSQQSERRLEQLAHLFEGQKEWELRIIWVTPTSTQPAVRKQPTATVKRRIAEVRSLAERELIQPALLLAWATFEALARGLSPHQFKRPQTPGRLVQVLARDGYLTPTEADRLRELADKRNRLIHGELQVRVSKGDLTAFLAILNTLVKMLGK
jgi:uncharacterized protein YutE (UPF0331/DUF86 family)